MQQCGQSCGPNPAHSHRRRPTGRVKTARQHRYRISNRVDEPTTQRHANSGEVRSGWVPGSGKAGKATARSGRVRRRRAGRGDVGRGGRRPRAAAIVHSRIPLRLASLLLRRGGACGGGGGASGALVACAPVGLLWAEHSSAGAGLEVEAARRAMAYGPLLLLSRVRRSPWAMNYWRFEAQMCPFGPKIFLVVAATDYRVGSLLVLGSSSTKIMA